MLATPPPQIAQWPTRPTSPCGLAGTDNAPSDRSARSDRAALGPATFDLDAFRRRRFSGGLRCPRCGGQAVHRWGRFKNRRRYRCLGCDRTFSDLTGTPLAYLKRIDRWPSFCDAMLMSWPVRQTATALTIHPATAFRWRHRQLDGLQAAEPRPLEGDVAVGEAYYPYSEKGRRNPGRVARRRGDPSWRFDDRVWVVLARDSSGRPVAEPAGTSRPRLRDLERVLLPHLSPGARILDTAGPAGAAACLARREGMAYARMTGRALLEHPAIAYGVELRRWLAAFRGVATKYLSNYLAWHRFLALSERAQLGRPAARLSLLDCCFP